MMQEKHIIDEKGPYWIYEWPACYEVLKNTGAHSIVDSAYPKTDDGLSLAIARFKYLARKI